MRTDVAKKLISISMAVLFAASSASCTSAKKEYDVIKDSDTWYECSSFEVSDLYPKDQYDYCTFDTVGSMDNAVYVMAMALRHFDGDYSNMSDEELLKYYEQSILEFSFDGELLDKTDFISESSENCFKLLQKAWVSEDRLNLLEDEYNITNNSSKYYFNGEELILPDISNYYNDPIYISDIYTVAGYTVCKLDIGSWREDIVVIRPDGTYYNFDPEDVVDTNISFTGSFLPAENDKLVIPVYLHTGEDVFLSFDPATGDCEELKGLYGKSGYWLEYASGKTIARDYSGFSLVDNNTGELTPLFDYNDVNALISDVMDAQTLYVSDSGNEIILGLNIYDSAGFVSGDSCYRILHLSRAEANPNAGKTRLILTTEGDFYPETSDFLAIQHFNSGNGSFFINYVFPVEEDGNKKDVDADIILAYDPSQDPSDKSLYANLAPYLDLNSGSYSEEFFANAIDAARTGDSLYRVPLDISASGIITASVNVPQDQHGFTFDSYIQFVDEVCNGTDPMCRTKGYMMGKTEYFTKLFMNMSDVFIYGGKAHLDCEEFRDLMLFVDEHGSDDTLSEEEINGSLVEQHNDELQETIDVLEGRSAGIEGKYGAMYGNLSSFQDYITCYIRYGEGLGIYGLPSFDGRGPQTLSHEFVSVSSKTLYVDACAEFVKLLLSYDIQKTKTTNPVNRNALQASAEEYLNAYNKEMEIESRLGLTGASQIPSEAVSKYIDILTSSYSGTNAGGAIEDIIREESSSYFTGGRALEDVIPVMQKRIQTVLNETA